MFVQKVTRCDYIPAASFIGVLIIKVCKRPESEARPDLRHLHRSAASLRGLRTSPCSKRLPRPFGTSGPTPGRPASQYGGSTGAEELNSRNLSMISKGFGMCQQRGIGGIGVVADVAPL